MSLTCHIRHISMVSFPRELANEPRDSPLGRTSYYKVYKDKDEALRKIDFDKDRRPDRRRVQTAVQTRMSLVGS